MTVGWFVLTGTRCGTDRSRILLGLDEGAQTPKQLADALRLDVQVVQDHLEVLEQNNLVQTREEDLTVYLPTPQIRAEWETVEEIAGDIGAKRTEQPIQPKF